MSKLAHLIEDNKRTEDVVIKESHTFESLLLPQNVLSGLKKNGFIKPSPIQLKAIPVGRCGFGKETFIELVIVIKHCSFIITCKMLR